MGLSMVGRWLGGSLPGVVRFAVNYVTQILMIAKIFDSCITMSRTHIGLELIPYSSFYMRPKH